MSTGWACDSCREGSRRSVGKAVNLFAVFGDGGSTSHIRALAELTEILYDQANIDSCARAVLEEILRLIRQDES